MAPFWSFSAVLLALMAFTCPLALASQQKNMHVSTISAAPTTLPGSPLLSPTLSPDIEPLFPTPGKYAYSSSESSLPTIPSSPSPPNPHIIGHQGHDFAFPPSESNPGCISSTVLNFTIGHAGNLYNAALWRVTTCWSWCYFLQKHVFFFQHYLFSIYHVMCTAMHVDGCLYHVSISFYLFPQNQL